MIVGMGDDSYEEELADLGDPLIWTPGSIQSLLDQVRGEIEVTAQYVTALRKESGALAVGDAMLSSFKVFYNEAQGFFASVGFFAKLTGATVERLKDLQDRNKTWRGQLDKRASDVGSNVNPGPAPGGSKPSALDQIFAQLGKVGTFIAVTGALLLAYKIASETGLLRRIASRGKTVRNPGRRRRRGEHLSSVAPHFKSFAAMERWWKRQSGRHPIRWASPSQARMWTNGNRRKYTTVRGIAGLVPRSQVSRARAVAKKKRRAWKAYHRRTGPRPRLSKEALMYRARFGTGLDARFD